MLRQNSQKALRQLAQKTHANNTITLALNIPRFSRQKSLTKTESINAKIYKAQEDEPIQS